MVRKRTVDWKPLTAEEQEEVAMAVYKRKFPDEDEPDEADVRWALDDRDWDAAATPEAMAWMVVRAQELFSEGLGHPGHPRQKLRYAAVLANRLAGGGEVYRDDALNAMEQAGCLPAREEAVETVMELAEQVELVSFLPPDLPVHTATSVTEALDRMDYEQIRSLARGALIGLGILGSDLEWKSDHVEWVASALLAETDAEMPSISDEDPAVANWWRRLLGGRDPLVRDEDGYVDEATLPFFDPAVPMWAPEEPQLPLNEG